MNIQPTNYIPRDLDALKQGLGDFKVEEGRWVVNKDGAEVAYEIKLVRTTGLKEEIAIASTKINNHFKDKLTEQEKNDIVSITENALMQHIDEFSEAKPSTKNNSVKQKKYVYNSMKKVKNGSKWITKKYEGILSIIVSFFRRDSNTTFNPKARSILNPVNPGFVEPAEGGKRQEITQRRLEKIGKVIEKLNEAASLQTEGMFRLSGPKPTVDGINNAIFNDDADIIVDDFTVIELAAALKADFRATCQLDVNKTDAFLSAMNSKNEADKIAEMKAVLSELSPNQIKYLYEVFDLLKNVNNYSEINRMTSKNLSLVMAPNIFYLKTNDLIQKSRLINDACQFMIEHHEEIFDGLTRPRAGKEQAL